MDAVAGPLLDSLFATDEPAIRASVWERLLALYSPALLHAARAMGGDRDVIMDRYAFVLDGLARDDFHRLRVYLVEGRGEFTTWLLVVARRLCLDHHRQRYGRLQTDDPTATVRRSARRKLTDLLGDELGLVQLTSGEAAPDHRLQQAERDQALAEALDRLDPADRLLIRLRFVEGLSAGQIARVLDRSSPFVVYRRIAKLLATLRIELVERGIKDSVP